VAGKVRISERVQSQRQGSGNMSEIYVYNIMLEAKTRAMVAITKKYHPDWSNERIREFLKNAMDYAVTKELEETVKA